MFVMLVPRAETIAGCNMSVSCTVSSQNSQPNGWTAAAVCIHYFEVPRNSEVLFNVWEHHHNDILLKTALFGLYSYSMGLTLSDVAIKCPDFSKITQNNGHYAVQGHSSRSRISVPMERWHGLALYE